MAARVSLDLDVASAEREITNFIARVVEGARAKGVVLGLSGGIDSAVVGALCVKALGKEKVVALLMPSEHTPAEDVEDAKSLASAWGVKAHVVPISELGKAFFAAMPVEGDKVAKGNVHARVRMATCYYFANAMKLLVAGTGDRSEELLGFFCYDDKTRVATTDGPKGIDELVKGDTVFSLEPLTRKIVEVPVQDVFRFDYAGKMVHFQSRSTDLLVTPNHRMLIQQSSSNVESPCVFRRAEDCLRYRSTITPLPSRWDGRPPRQKTIGVAFRQRGISRAIDMSIEDAFYLFGLFIGDGCVTRGKVTIPIKSGLTQREHLSLPRSTSGRFLSLSSEIVQPHMKTYDTYETTFALPVYTKPMARTRLVDILDKYGIGHSYTRDTVRIPSKGIHDLFAQFGIGARNKMIPGWILQYPSESLGHLLRGLKDSDGTHSESMNIYYTSSERLKDDFVQLCFKLGRKASVRRREARTPRIDGKIINTGASFEISFQGRPHGQHAILNSHARLIDYKGRIWCPSVPPWENLLVERNGKFIFCGNTKGGDGVVDFLPIAHLYKTQVRQLGEHLGIPERVVNKPPSPRLWPGHLATDELPADYATLDRVLHCLFDEMMQPEAAAKEAEVSREVVDAVLKMNSRSEHKRTSPPMVK